jgi:hypothetical protein
MKLNWTETGAIKFADGSTQDYEAVWKGLTHAEADGRVKQLVEENIRKRRVRGAGFNATARGPEGTSMIVMSQWK